MLFVSDGDNRLHVFALKHETGFGPYNPFVLRDVDVSVVN